MGSVARIRIVFLSLLQRTGQLLCLIVHAKMLVQVSSAQNTPVCAIDFRGLYLSQPNLLLRLLSVCGVSRSNKNVHKPQCRRNSKVDPPIRGLAPSCCVLSCVRASGRCTGARSKRWFLRCSNKCAVL